MKLKFQAGKKYKSTFPGNIYSVMRRTTSRITLLQEGATVPVTKTVKQSELGEFVNLDSCTLYAKDEVMG